MIDLRTARLRVAERGLLTAALLAPLALASCTEDSNPLTPLDTLAPQAAKPAPSTPAAPTGRLYFTGDLYEPGNLDIYAVNPDGTGLVRLTTAAGDDQLPRAATTSGRIAFLSDRNNQQAIYVMNSDGSDQHAVYTPGYGTIGSLALSADGAAVAFTATSGGQTDIWLLEIGGAVTRVTSDAIEELNPAFAPNGRELAYQATVNGATDIFRISLRNGSVRRLTNGEYGGNMNPAYTPDGRSLLFVSGRDGNYDVYSMRADGTRQTRILDTAGWHEAFPAVSPDGRYYAFLSYLASGAGTVHMRYTLIGNTNLTGPVSSSTSILGVTWGL